MEGWLAFFHQALQSLASLSFPMKISFNWKGEEEGGSWKWCSILGLDIKGTGSGLETVARWLPASVTCRTSQCSYPAISYSSLNNFPSVILLSSLLHIYEASKTAVQEISKMLFNYIRRWIYSCWSELRNCIDITSQLRYHSFHPQKVVLSISCRKRQKRCFCL